MKRNRKGFTLIELLLVIAIIGILMSIVLANLNVARQKARDTKRVSDLEQIQLALENYYDDALCGGQGCFPYCPGNITQCGSNKYPSPAHWSGLGSTLSPYIALPIDPTNTLNEYGYYYVNTLKRMSDFVESSGRLQIRICQVLPISPSTYILATRLERTTNTVVRVCPSCFAPGSCSSYLANNPNLNYVLSPY